VIDKQTGKAPDLWQIALKEAWARHLTFCDMEGFAIEEDGSLILLDECGNFAYCPTDRFEISVLATAAPDACPVCGDDGIETTTTQPNQ